MAELSLGALAAVTASVLFSAGLVLQSLEARTIPPEHSLRLSLIARLLGRRRWIAGGLIMVVGFGFHVCALLLAPLTVVQPSLAAGLIVLVVAGARHDAEPVHGRDVLAVLAISLGVVGLTLTASQRNTLTVSAGRLALALIPLAAAALAPYGVALLGSRHGRSGGLSATLGAGAAYALTGLTTKLVSDRIAAADWGGAILWLAITASAAGLALIDQTTALQRRGAKQVGVIIYVMPVVVPVVVAAVLLGESWAASPAAAVVLALSVTAVCAGAAALSGSRRVVALEAATQPRR
jgi:drug/metabolite transporter (DMT)-like permease